MEQMNQEKELLKTLIDALNSSSEREYMWNLEDNESSTYFLDPSQEPFEPIMEYDVEKPIEFQSRLEKLWQARHCEFKRIIPVITVATFKNRNRTLEKPIISDYIYEF